MTSTYTNKKFSRFIDKEKVTCVFELGSRDLLDAVQIKNHYNPNKIYSFECNPECVVFLQRNFKKKSWFKE